ncbi:WD repeat-containing protein 44-like [Impatiens glandulifera]|uniref:WD repeat-containing protein 44-like n=1 Tax=Impatiens glandulifera TaxID=253017 RepID=UPI001FB130FC|nr:WD repeat-containing protein 44-like [Impatiens glandulifera]
MGSLGDDDDDEDSGFFDAYEHIVSTPESPSSCLSEHDVWIQAPQSVEERRSKFLNWMGLNSNTDGVEIVLEISKDESSVSSSDLCQESVSNISRKINSSIVVLEQKSKRNVLHVRDFPRLTSLNQQPKQKDNNVNIREVVNRVKERWLSKLRSATCSLDRNGVSDRLNPNYSKIQRIQVQQHKKQSKELSALYIGQEIEAHDGSILTMKFSLGGEYLATAGEDGVVCIWQVVEDVRSNETDIPNIDSSCMYFTVNRLSQLVPIVVQKEKMRKMKSPCVIFPPKVFRILEKPLHRFHGHVDDILDLAWSKNNCLLSSSVDKTVRLWKVGSDECLKVFPHGNYVTCVQFNPVSDDYFISGSIDGKIRVWEVASCHVVDWTDTRDIVTAVCFQPDGQGAIVGSITGICRFYDISVVENQFQLKSIIFLDSKKKASNKRITGFQLFPRDQTKVMVTCTDSQVRILDENGVIGKYKGVQSQISASFASDGMHMLSTCEDSNVYLWNCMNEDESETVVCSWERFSSNASVALPWLGLKQEPENIRKGCKISFPSPASFSLSPEFVLESFTKGSATWPEEKLVYSSPRASASSLQKSQYNFLKTSCQSTSNTHHAWGLVIVTAGWDGCIRSFFNYGLPVPQ